MLPFVITWINLEGIKPSEMVSQITGNRLMVSGAGGWGALIGSGTKYKLPVIKQALKM